MAGLEGIVRVRGDLVLQGLAIDDLTGLDNLQGVDDYFYLGSELLQLTSLAGLEQLASVDGPFNILDCPNLVDIAALESLTSAYSLTIINTGLGALDGLQPLTSLEYSFTADRNAVLVSLSGLDNLATVNRLAISRNPVLADISALGSVGGALPNRPGRVCDGQLGHYLRQRRPHRPHRVGHAGGVDLLP